MESEGDDSDDKEESTSLKQTTNGEKQYKNKGTVSEGKLKNKREYKEARKKIK